MQQSWRGAGQPLAGREEVTETKLGCGWSPLHVRVVSSACLVLLVLPNTGKSPAAPGDVSLSHLHQRAAFLPGRCLGERPVGQKCCPIESAPLEMGEEDVSWPMAPAAPCVPSRGGDLPPAHAASTRVRQARRAPAASLRKEPAQRRRAQLWGFYCHRLRASLAPFCSDRLGTRPARLVCNGPISDREPAAPRAVSRHGRGSS